MLFNAWSVPPSRDELFQLNLQDSRQLRDSVLCSVHFINDSCLFESYSDPRTQSQYSRRPWKILTIVIIPILRMKTLRVRKVSSSSKGTEPTSLQLKLTSVPSCVLSIAFVVYPKFKCVSSVFISYFWQPHVWLSYGLWIALSLGTLPLHISFQQMELYPASGSRTFHRVFSTLIHWKMSTWSLKPMSTASATPVAISPVPPAHTSGTYLYHCLFHHILIMVTRPLPRRISVN